MAEEKVSELLACPLCSVEMVETRVEGWDGNPLPEKWIVHPAGEHAACPIAALQFIKTPLSIAAWNRRTPTPATEDVGDWVMVPRKPTLDMVQAHYEAHADAETVFAEAETVYEYMLNAAPSPPKADGPGEVSRDGRQKQVAEWCAAAFGVEHQASVQQRGLRMLEEAIEAYQATGGNTEQAHNLIDYIFAKEPGQLFQELGGVGITVLALAAAAGLSADDAETAELTRVLSKPLAWFHARNKVKNEAGFDATAYPSSKPKEA